MKLCGFVFVNYMDFLQKDYREEGTIRNVTFDMQGSLYHCQGVTQSTDCVLDATNQKTCCGYTMSYMWNNGLWKYSALDEDLEIMTENFEDNKVPVHHWDVEERKKKVGVILAPDGNNRL